MSSIFSNLLSRFSNSPAPVQPVASVATVVGGNSAEVTFGFSNNGIQQYTLDQTYASFVEQQATASGVALQKNYTPQFIVNGQLFVVNPNATFADLHAKYEVTSDSNVKVSIPDPEKPQGKQG